MYADFVNVSLVKNSPTNPSRLGSVVSVEISGKFGFSALIRAHPR
jgi:hypothetical protein